MKQVAVVTGGSQGLGLALARELAAAGYAVVIDARRADRLSAAVQQLAASGSVHAVAGDVRDGEHRRALIEAAAALGLIAVLVNNASTLGPTPLPAVTDTPVDGLRATFDVNVVAPVALLQLAAPHLAPGATIVNITSDAAASAYAGWGSYGASKAALEHIGGVLGVERPDLRVLTVDPGDMRTEMHQAAFAGEDISDRPEPDASAAAISRLLASDRPSGRYVTAELDLSRMPS